MWILIAGFASTTLHYPHNFIYADDYPPVFPFFPNSLAYRVGILVFYPLLTAAAVHGYRLYASGRTRNALPFLGAYSLLGFTSPFYFVGGVPDIPAFFFATIFTDGITGALVIWFAWRADRWNRSRPRDGRGTDDIRTAAAS